jgi:hypothetical protein
MVELSTEAKTMKQKMMKDTIASRAKKLMGADRRMFKKFRGQHVAYIDVWKKTEAGIRLVRKIIANGDLGDINQAWAYLPTRLRSRMVLRFIDDLPPNTIRCDSFVIGPE